MDEDHPELTTDLPFSLVPEWLLDADISDRAVRLYGVLGRYADADGASFPSRRTLADRMRCSVDSIDRATKELTDAGALTVYHRLDDQGDRTSNLYVIQRVAAQQRPPRTAAATGSRTAAAQNENHHGRVPPAVEPREPGVSVLPLTAKDPRGVTRARDYDALKGAKIDGRNLPFDALAEETNCDHEYDAKAVATALKQIRKRAVGIAKRQGRSVTNPEIVEPALADAIRARAAAYRDRWPGIELTPMALAKHWDRVTAPKPEPAQALRYGRGMTTEQILRDFGGVR